MKILSAFFCFTAFGASILLADTLDLFDANSTVSTRSATYLDWSSNIPLTGGIVFGKGQAKFMIGDENKQKSLRANAIYLRFDRRKKLEIVTKGGGKGFSLPVHSFAVCPMARHVARGADIAYTIPPIITMTLFIKHKMTKSVKNGFIATEFANDKKMEKLVSDADFWIEHPRRKVTYMSPRNRKLILRDANRARVTMPSEFSLYRGFTYFSGDFHVDGVVFLNTMTSTATVYGEPIVYYPRDIGGGYITISNVEFLSYHPGEALANNTRFGPRDFRSLFDLSLLFAAVKNNHAPDLRDFINKYCN